MKTWTTKEIQNIAMEQSAFDSNCQAQDFQTSQNRIVISTKNVKARKYLELPFACDLTSYGDCIVASVSKELQDIVTQYINKFPVEHCFETPNLHYLMNQIRPLGYDVCYMAEYSLPDENLLKGRVELTCPYPIKILYPQDFADCYITQWSNALCEARKELDVLAVGAYDGNQLIGLAGASADCDTMWQIGVDVLPEYRRKGIASMLTSTLAIEILKKGIVPFYCCAWSNVKSIRNAMKSGFRPAWVQLTVKSIKKITEINNNGKNF